MSTGTSDPRQVLIGRLAVSGLDNGQPVQIATNRFAYSDGSISTHDGYAPYIIPPPEDFREVLKVKRAYAREKWRRALGALRQLETSDRWHQAWQWPKELAGLEPKPLPSGEGDVKAALNVLRVIVAHHRGGYEAATRRLGDAGVLVMEIPALMADLM